MESNPRNIFPGCLNKKSNFLFNNLSSLFKFAKEEYPQNNSSAPSPVRATEYPPSLTEEKIILLGMIEVSSKGLSHIFEVRLRELSTSV